MEAAEDEIRSQEEFSLLNGQLAVISDIPRWYEYISLKSICLHGNKLKSISGLDHLTRLTRLDLSSNAITSMKGLMSLENLKSISLSANMLTKVEGLGSLHHLETLVLSYNRISSLRGFRDVATKNNRLKNVDLRGNKLSLLSELEYLRGVASLRAIIFHRGERDSNPFCRQSDYRSRLQTTLPQITSSDEEANIHHRHMESNYVEELSLFLRRKVPPQPPPEAVPAAEGQEAGLPAVEAAAGVSEPVAEPGSSGGALSGSIHDNPWEKAGSPPGKKLKQRFEAVALPKEHRRIQTDPVTLNDEETRAHQAALETLRDRVKTLEQNRNAEIARAVRSGRQMEIQEMEERKAIAQGSNTSRGVLVSFVSETEKALRQARTRVQDQGVEIASTHRKLSQSEREVIKKEQQVSGLKKTVELLRKEVVAKGKKIEVISENLVTRNADFQTQGLSLQKEIAGHVKSLQACRQERDGLKKAVQDATEENKRIAGLLHQQQLIAEKLEARAGDLARSVDSLRDDLNHEKVKNKEQEYESQRRATAAEASFKRRLAETKSLSDKDAAKIYHEVGDLNTRLQAADEQLSIEKGELERTRQMLKLSVRKEIRATAAVGQVSEVLREQKDRIVQLERLRKEMAERDRIRSKDYDTVQTELSAALASQTSTQGTHAKLVREITDLKARQQVFVDSENSLKADAQALQKRLREVAEVAKAERAENKKLRRNIEELKRQTRKTVETKEEKASEIQDLKAQLEKLKIGVDRAKESIAKRDEKVEDLAEERKELLEYVKDLEKTAKQKEVAIGFFEEQISQMKRLFEEEKRKAASSSSQELQRMEGRIATIISDSAAVEERLKGQLAEQDEQLRALKTEGAARDRKFKERAEGHAAVLSEMENRYRQIMRQFQDKHRAELDKVVREKMEVEAELRMMQKERMQKRKEAADQVSKLAGMMNEFGKNL